MARRFVWARTMTISGKRMKISLGPWRAVKPLYEIGSHIGGYKLLSVLGEGGFGMVYLAEQQHPIKRLVVLKVIKPGMDTKQVIARFETERQALALLDHPHIARVFDPLCQAIQHAHQKGIIHREIKPSKRSPATSTSSRRTV